MPNDTHYEVHDFSDPWEHRPFILLLHGHGRSSRFWYRLVPFLSRHYRVVTIDLPGHGRSPARIDPETGLSADAFIDDILAVLKALGCQSFHFVGESFGGMLGVLFADKYADMVRTLTLISTPPFINQETKSLGLGHLSQAQALAQLQTPGWSKSASAAFRFPPGTAEGLSDWYSAETETCDPSVMIAMTKLLDEVDVTPFLPRLKVPVLGLYPTKGRTINADQEAVLRTVPRLKMIHFPTPYHLIWILMPEICAKYILAFLAMEDGIFLA